MTMPWPVHPRPRELEKLSSWITRIADEYRMSYGDFLRAVYGEPVSEIVADFNPPKKLLTLLSEKTGQPVSTIMRLTVKGLYHPDPIPQGVTPFGPTGLIDYAARKRSPYAKYLGENW